MSAANNVFIKGQVARISCTVKENETLSDPTAIILKVKIGTGTVTDYTTSSDPPIVKDSTGKYHLDLVLNTVGTYRVRWEGSGLTKGAGESVFTVKESSLV